MLLRKICSFSALTLALAIAAPASAIPVYDEAINGDFSNTRGTPTVVNFAVGQNDVFGQTGSLSGVTDRDYFTFTVPIGSSLVSVTVLNSVLTGGNATFFGLQAGGAVTVDPAAPDASLLLGYELVSPSDIGTDVLPAMAIAAGAGGFTVPLGAGQYAVWLQDSNVAPSIYGLRFEVASIPEPSTTMLLLMSLAALGLIRRKKV
jgi:hypothetical protein